MLEIVYVVSPLILSTVKINNPTLESRFKTFLASSGAEDLDSLTAANQLFDGGKRADYLLDDRKIVLELKAVKNDPEYKVDEHLLPLQDRADYPHFYWPTEINNILSYLSDGKKIAEKIGDAVTKNIQGYISSADDQIRETKLALDIPLAGGVLVILNQDVGILNPNLIVSQIRRMLNKRKPDGHLRYVEIAYVWILSEAHKITLESTTEATPSVLFEGPLSKQFPQVAEYLLELDKNFAKFEGIPYDLIPFW